jgi:hypothetical protein
MTLTGVAAETGLTGVALYNNLSTDFKTRPTGFSADALFDGDGYLAFITNQPLKLAQSPKAGVPLLCSKKQQNAWVRLREPRQGH